MATTQIKNGFNGGSDAQLLVNPDGSINVNTSGGGGGSNVNIHDSAGNALTSTTGALNVNVVSEIPSPPITTISQYDTIASIAMGATATILTYTVPAGKTLYLNKVMVSSDSISDIEIQFNAAVNSKKRLTYTQFNETFDYSITETVSGYEVSTGTIITVVGTNNSQTGPAEYNATLQGVLQ